MVLRILLIITFAVFTSFPQEHYYCSVEIKNKFPLEEGFITFYLGRKISEILTEVGWRKNCQKGKNVEVVVNEVDYEGTSIGNNRFSGYTFRIAFSLKLPDGRKFNYNFSKFVSLPNPSLGTLKIRSALIDLLDTYQLRIKKDLINP
jgi:hypothetical protein